MCVIPEYEVIFYENIMLLVAKWAMYMATKRLN